MNKLNGLALFLASYRCDKGCPFCIAKDNERLLNKFENLNFVESLLSEMEKHNLKFEKFILSGMGEPSLYEINALKTICDAVRKHKGLFDKVRVYSSGNLMFEEEKFVEIHKVFNQYNFLINSFNPVIDMKITNYNKNYWETENIKKCQSIKLDVSLTKFLDKETLIFDIKKKIKDFPNIHKIKLKSLKCQCNPNSNQTKWILENEMNKEEIEKVRDLLIENFTTADNVHFYTPDKVEIVLNKPNRRDPSFWIFIKNNKMFNYEDKEINFDEVLQNTYRSKI